MIGNPPRLKERPLPGGVTEILKGRVARLADVPPPHEQASAI